VYKMDAFRYILLSEKFEVCVCLENITKFHNGDVTVMCSVDTEHGDITESVT